MALGAKGAGGKTKKQRPRPGDPATPEQASRQAEAFPRRGTARCQHRTPPRGATRFPHRRGQARGGPCDTASGPGPPGSVATRGPVARGSRGAAPVSSGPVAGVGGVASMSDLSPCCGLRGGGGDAHGTDPRGGWSCGGAGWHAEGSEAVSHPTRPGGRCAGPARRWACQAAGRVLREAGGASQARLVPEPAPNKGVQATGNSLRSCLALAIPSA